MSRVKIPTSYPGYTNFSLDYSCDKYAGVYFNVTCKATSDYAVLMFGYISPFLLVVTTVSNILLFAVLSRPHMRTPTNVLLIAIAFCDMFNILVPAPWHFYFFTLGNHYKPLGPAAICQTWEYMTEVIPTMFHTASIWLTVALAAQRYIYVCHTSVARNWFTIRRVVQGVICIGMAAFLYQLVRLLDYKAIPHKTVWAGKLEEVCVWSWASWVKTISTRRYMVLYHVFTVLFVYVIPCTSLVVFKVLLIRAMKRAQLNRNKLFKENKKSEVRRLRETNSTTSMLIIVLSVFLLVELPTAIVLLYRLISMTIFPSLGTNFVFWLLPIVTFINDFSYPLNFAIYCTMSQRFRDTFKGLFIRNANIIANE